MKKLRPLILSTLIFSLVFPAINAQAMPKLNQFEEIFADDGFKKAGVNLELGFDKIIEDTITLTQIPAPPFGEEKRAQYFKGLFEQIGLKDVEIDAEGNVLGLRKGQKSGGPLLVVAAHLDTVFPLSTDVTVKKDGNRLYAPGIGDDTVGLAIMLGLIRAMDAGKIKTKYDILFVGDVGEEGLGDLRGTRYLFQKGKYKERIKSFISLEPGSGGGIVDQGIGSRRYNVDFIGPGGHSYGDFGMVNPAYAMADAIVNFAKYPTNRPDNTTFNIGVLSGGTSVNSIPFKVSMSVDMRSGSNIELENIDKYFHEKIANAIIKENSTRNINRGEVRAEFKPIGNRPTGKTPENSNILKITKGIYSALGLDIRTDASSTDSNIPMSMGIEALTLGAGIGGDGAHSPQEYIEIKREENLQTMKANLAIIIALANSL